VDVYDLKLNDGTCTTVNQSTDLTESSIFDDIDPQGWNEISDSVSQHRYSTFGTQSTSQPRPAPVVLTFRRLWRSQSILTDSLWNLPHACGFWNLDVADCLICTRIPLIKQLLAHCSGYMGIDRVKWEQ
jgi:hypothetical protein